MLVPLPKRRAVDPAMAANERAHERARLEKVLRATDAKRAELHALRSAVMNIRTQRAELDFRCVAIEDRKERLVRTVEQKRREAEALRVLGETAVHELTLAYELQVRQTKMAAQLLERRLQELLQPQIELLLTLHVRQLQKERAELQARVETARTEVEAARAQHKVRSEERRREAQERETQERGRLHEALRVLAAREQQAAAETTAVEASAATAAASAASLRTALETLRAQHTAAEQTHADVASEVLSLRESAAALSAQAAALRNAAVAADSAATTLAGSTAALASSLAAAETSRRTLHACLQDLKGNIRVFCRVRPALRGEGAPLALAIAGDDDDLYRQELDITHNAHHHTFVYDRVFGEHATNADVFEEMSQVVQSALDGTNVCVFAYGQTGSGKTHTMLAKDDGMIPRAVAQLFATAQRLAPHGWRYSFQGQCVEVYNEQVYDLLANRTRRDVRHDPGTNTTEAVGATTVALDSPAAVQRLLHTAARSQTVAATKANEHSSRAHLVFSVRIEGRCGTKTHAGVLHLVDLAGSERLAHSQATGERLRETQAINRLLACLGDVVHALGSADPKHVPYRNSKLTFMLQNALGGVLKTLMLVNVLPCADHYGETMLSLRFAAKVNQVRNRRL